MMRTFRMPYQPKPLAEVASSASHAAGPCHDIATGHLRASAGGRRRWTRTGLREPAACEIHVPGLPDDAEEVARRASINERNQKGRLQGSEGKKVLLHKFARRVDHAIRGVLAGHAAPLVLAADEPLASIFRSINTYPALVEELIAGNPNLISDAQLEDAALPILDRIYQRELKAILARFDELKPRRATTDVSYAAHAATAGAIDQLLVDLDAVVPGVVSDIDGVCNLRGIQ